MPDFKLADELCERHKELTAGLQQKTDKLNSETQAQFQLYLSIRGELEKYIFGDEQEEQQKDKRKEPKIIPLEKATPAHQATPSETHEAKLIHINDESSYTQL